MRTILLAAAFGCAMALCVTRSAQASQWQAERTIDDRVGAASATQIVLRGDNGDLRMVAADTHEIVVHARIRTHDRASLANTGVNAHPVDDRIELDARCPQVHRWFGYTNACEIDATVTYPRDMKLDVEWVNGGIEVQAPRNDIVVRLTNGDLEVRDAAKSVTLSTRHGNVGASLGAGWHGDTIALAVSEGDVNLRVPRGFDGYLDASVRLGDVSNSARLPTSPASKKSVPVRATAVIGDVSVTN